MTVIRKEFNAEAAAAYKEVVNNYLYAQCWDTNGWFWKPAEAAQQKLVELEVLNWSPSVVGIIEDVGNVVFWVVVAFFGIWVFSKFFFNLGKLRGEA